MPDVLSLDDRTFCECGCGRPTTVYEGKPRRFLSGHNGALRRRTKRYEVRDCGYETPCWIWALALTAAGYGRECVAGTQVYAHRWHYEQAHGPIPEGLQIDHLCRNRACVNPEHLEAVESVENTRRGAGTKLAPQQVAEIRTSNLSNRHLGRIYGVSHSHIGEIKRGEQWA